MATRVDWARHSEREPLLPVYGIVSASELLLREAVQTLQSKVLSGAADFNRDVFEPGSGLTERLLSALNTLPMMAPKRVWLE